MPVRTEGGGGGGVVVGEEVGVGCVGVWRRVRRGGGGGGDLSTTKALFRDLQIQVLHQN